MEMINSIAKWTARFSFVSSILAAYLAGGARVSGDIRMEYFARGLAIGLVALSVLSLIVVRATG